MGFVVTDRHRADLDRLARSVRTGDAARDGLLRTHYRNHATERERRGLGRRIRRRRKPDGLWPARRCHVPLARHHLVRHRVHDDVAHPFREARPIRSRKHHRLDPRANAKASSGARKNSSGHSGADSGCAWPSPGTGSSAGANSATGAKPAARASQEITVLEQRRLRAISQTKSSALRIDVARSWRNWQTHQLEGLAVAIPWWFESTRPHYFFSHPARFWPDDFHS